MEEQEVSADLLLFRIAELQYDGNGHLKVIPDSSIPCAHCVYNGVAVIFKPIDDCRGYKKSHVQYLENARNYKVLVSGDYDHITERLVEFFNNGRLICPHCGEGCKRRYKTLESRDSHAWAFHHNIGSSSSSSDNFHRDPP